MPERFEIYIVYNRRYINTLPFLFVHYGDGEGNSNGENQQLFPQPSVLFVISS